MKSRILFFFIVLSVSMSAHYGETLKTDKDLSKISKALVYDIEKCQALISAKRKTQLTRDNRIWLKLVSAVIAQKKEDAYSATIIVEELKLQKIEDPFLNAYLLYVDALLNVPIKNFALALENTLEAKETFERLSEFAYVADCLSLEARIYTKLDRLEDAIESLSKSIAIHRSSNDSLHLAGDYHNLALVLDSTNNDSILNLIITATQMNKQIGNAFWEANNHYILSIHQMGRGNDSLAYTEIDIAKSLYESLHMYNMVLQTQLHTANMLYADSLPDSAQVLYLDVISKEKELRTGLNLETAYSNLAELAYTQRNLVDYRRFSQRAKHISDSLLNLVNQNTISVIEIRNKYKFKQTELTIANQDFMLESRTKSIWIAVISSLLIITFFLIYVVVKSRKLEKAKSALKELRLEQDLELKQK
ncbi:MAG: hypothetical protein N4A46_11855, partial [Schleiferiaceae bacterium]|nr:hypothetical protein [Schleiferiaceae bacterium]